MTHQQFQTVSRAATDYFSAESTAGAIFAFMGGVALLAAIVFFIKSKKWGDFWRGLAWPLGILGVVQLVVGVSVAWSAGLEEGFLPWEQDNPEMWIVDEISRMEGVMTQFYVLFVVELLLIGLGLYLALRGRKAGASRATSTGVGLGLMLQCVAILVFDVVAAMRADEYLSVLSGG